MRGFMQAIESGKLTRGGVVTEGSAGSTAISLATVAPNYGCKCHVVIPDDAAIEKVCIYVLLIRASSLDINVSDSCNNLECLLCTI